MKEQIHDDALQQALHSEQAPEQQYTEWAVDAADAAWHEDFPALTSSFAARTRQKLFWYGGRLAAALHAQQSAGEDVCSAVKTSEL